jgi:NAD(P)-dependent dehydrogenase (short-subunit alcohol dehydrogenase family)
MSEPRPKWNGYARRRRLGGAPVSILVNNAGIHLKKAAVQTMPAEFQAVLTTHVYAPNVQFLGPVFVGDINAADTATPVLLLGYGSDVRITGGDLAQANGRAVQVSGIEQLRFAAGTDSQGNTLPPKTNLGRIEENGTDVTFGIVVSLGL